MKRDVAKESSLILAVVSMAWLISQLTYPLYNEYSSPVLIWVVLGLILGWLADNYTTCFPLHMAATTCVFACGMFVGLSIWSAADRWFVSAMLVYGCAAVGMLFSYWILYRLLNRLGFYGTTETIQRSGGKNNAITRK